MKVTAFLFILSHLALVSFSSLAEVPTEDELVSRFVPEYAKVHLKKVSLRKLEAPHSLSDSIQLFYEVCGSTLTPLSDDQREKTYHLEFTATFDRNIPGDSSLCQVRQRGGKFRCLLAKRIKAKLLSDTYLDTCGNSLRGFAWITYTLPGENMMDSVSPGRSLEVAQRFNGSALYRPGPISQVELERFEFFETYSNE